MTDLMRARRSGEALVAKAVGGSGWMVADERFGEVAQFWLELCSVAEVLSQYPRRDLRVEAGFPKRGSDAKHAGQEISWVALALLQRVGVQAVECDPDEMMQSDLLLDHEAKVFDGEVSQRLCPQLVAALDGRGRVAWRRIPCGRVKDVEDSLALISRYLTLRGMPTKLSVTEPFVLVGLRGPSPRHLLLTMVAAQVPAGALEHVDCGQRERSGTTHAASQCHRVVRERVVAAERLDTSQFVIGQ